METIAEFSARPKSVPRKISRDSAQTKANQFIIEHLPDRFCAGQPRFVIFPIRAAWSIPVVLAYPKLGAIGEVGAVIVDAELGNVVGWTPIEEIREAAKELYEERKAEIEAPFV
ncbi:MAG: hypothetical protein AAB354_10215 [candidate division KSB1 bacterium]